MIRCVLGGALTVCICLWKVGGWGTAGQGGKSSCKVGLTALAGLKARMGPSELSPIGPQLARPCTSISVCIEGRDLGQGQGRGGLHVAAAVS